MSLAQFIRWANALRVPTLSPWQARQGAMRAAGVTPDGRLLLADRTVSVPYQVDAIATVDTTGLRHGQVIEAQGRLVAGDGGGGRFIYQAGSAAVADAGIVHTPAAGGGRLVRDGYTVFGYSGPVSDRWFGVRADGVTDDAAALNAALASTAARGEWLRLDAGRRHCGAKIVLPSGAKLTADPGAVLLRRASVSGSWGFLGNDPAVRASGIEIRGPLLIEGQDTTTYSGNIIAIYGDNCTVDGVRVLRYGGTAGGRAILWRGDNGLVSDFQATEPRQAAGVGGIRMAGGKGFRCFNSHVVSGDDAFQFVPGAADDMSIMDGMYIGCTGGSYKARLMVVGLVDPVAGNTTGAFSMPALGSTVVVNKTADNRLSAGDRLWIANAGYVVITAVNTPLQIVVRNGGDLGNAAPGTAIPAGSMVLRGDSQDIGAAGAMTASIRSVGFYSVKGWAKGDASNAICIRNSDSTGGIDGVSITDCDVDCTGALGLYQVYVEGSLYGAYPTTGISIEGLRLRGVPQTAIRAIGTDAYGTVDGLHIRRLRVDKAAQSGYPVVQLFGVSDGSMSASKITANGSQGVILGSAGNNCDGFLIGPGVTVRDIPDGVAGVQLAYTTACGVIRSRFVRQAGATLSRGIGAGATATGTYASGNDYSRVDTDIVASTVSEGSSGQWDMHQAPGANAATATLGRYRSADGSAIVDLYAESASGARSARIQRNPGATGALLIEQVGTGQLQIKLNNAVRAYWDSNGNIIPGTDNAMTLGKASNRWSVIYAATGAINTSDERAKQDIGAIPDDWLDAWADVQWQSYRMVDAVQAKGAAARAHIGLVAQRVRDAFAARGLDARQIGLLCFDAWPDEWEDVVDADGTPTGERRLLRAAGDAWGVRYDEAMAMESALIRRSLQRAGIPLH